MERPIFKDIGTKAIELDTPILSVDLDYLDYNLNYYNLNWQASQDLPVIAQNVSVPFVAIANKSNPSICR